MGFAQRSTKVVPALAAFLALLVAGSVAPRLFAQSISLHHWSVTSLAAHHQRPKFDSDRLNWSGPVQVFPPLPPDAETEDASPAPQMSSPLQVKGFRYNRPPPVA
jgi:hypothetical protein